MSIENTKYCDTDTAIRDTTIDDIEGERHVLWRLSSWQTYQVIPHGESYGSPGSGLSPYVHGKLDGSVVLQYTMRGSIWCMYDGEEIEVPAGHAYIFPTGAETRWKKKTDPEYISCWMLITGAGLLEHWELMRDVHGPVIAMQQDGRVMTAFDKVIALHQQHADVSTEALAIHAFVMALYQHCERGQAEKLSPVQRAVQHIVRYPLHTHSMKEIANSHGVSREHVARVFTEELGEAPATWLRRQRYAHACELLSRTEMSIKDVAAQSGFGSVDSLARILQQEQGQSPTEYRQCQALGHLQ